jgi:hypothetical protein
VRVPDIFQRLQCGTMGNLQVTRKGHDVDSLAGV